MLIFTAEFLSLTAHQLQFFNFVPNNYARFWGVLLGLNLSFNEPNLGK